MKLLSWECKKCITNPALWIYVILCLAMNTWFLLVDGYPEDVNAFSKELSRSESRLPEGEDTLDGYDSSFLSNMVNEHLNLNGFWKNRMDQKYDKLQMVIDSFAERNVSLDVYAGVYTNEIHKRLFYKTIKLITTESILLSVLIVIYLLGYECLHKTETVIYCSKTGRSLIKHKHMAGFLYTIGGFLLIGGYTLTLYFIIWDYSGFINGNVSSQWNGIRDRFTSRPFLTWHSLTVFQYLTITLMLSLLLIIGFSLLGSVIGILIRNAYVAFLVLLLVSGGMIVAMFLFMDIGFMEGYFLSLFTLTPLWYLQPQWLTDMGGFSFIPYHETFAILGNLFTLSILVNMSVKQFYRKDLIS